MRKLTITYSTPPDRPIDDAATANLQLGSDGYSDDKGRPGVIRANFQNTRNATVMVDTETSPFSTQSIILGSPDRGESVLAWSSDGQFVTLEFDAEDATINATLLGSGASVGINISN